MADKITFQQLIDEFSEQSGRTKAFSSKFIKDIFISIQEGLRKDENVNIKGIGIFKLQEVAERETLNPKTGRTAVIEAHKKIVFRPEKALRERVNQKYADLKPQTLEEKKETVIDKTIPHPIPTFRGHTPSKNRNPITSSIINQDKILNLNKIFGSDDLPTNDELSKENPLLKDRLLNTENEKVENEIIEDKSPQTIEELVQITKSATTPKTAEEKIETSPKPAKGSVEHMVFGEQSEDNENEISKNLPWLNDSPSISNLDTESKISPTFIIEKRRNRSSWRWIFPLILILLIIAVIYLVPQKSIKISDLAFWRNTESSTLLDKEVKDNDHSTVKDKENTSIKDESKSKVTAPKKDSSENKIGNIFINLKERGIASKEVENKPNSVVSSSKNIKTVTQAPEDEKVLIHIIQPGNTLWGLSIQYYNRSSLWPNIYRKNIEILPTPDFLPLGKKLLVPELSGDSYELTKVDSARIAQGYYLAYSAYKKYDAEKAKGYLNMAKRFSTILE